MPVIDLLRHGETVRPHALLGRTDAPLSERGWRDVERQTKGRSWDAIVTSPLQRAAAAAERIAAERGLAAEIVPDWSEIDFGAWDGQDLDVLRRDPKAANLLDVFYRNPEMLDAPGGETYAAVASRVARGLNALAEREGRILLVAHGGTIRVALSLALDLPIAKLWALRLDCATRVTLNLGVHPTHGLWAELLEIAQP